MSTCCDHSDQPPHTKANLTVALAGNPNSGKTTIFNALTGLRQKVANYPGVTVEKKTGRCKLEGGVRADVIDLPGTYSLISRAPDEHVAMEVLRGLRKDTPRPDVVVVVVDASNLQRNLYLVSQLIEMGRPMVVALNMMDVAQRRGIHVSPERLQKQLGVPVIPIVGHKKQGIAELKRAILSAVIAPMPDWPLPEAMKEELLLVGGALSILDSDDAAAGSHPNPLPEYREREEMPERERMCLDCYQGLAERLLIGDRAPDIEPYTRREPVSSLLSHATTRLAQLGIDPMHADVEAHYRWIENVSAGSLIPACEALLGGTGAPPVLDYEPKKLTLTDKVDRILIHKVWGLLIFASIMGVLFVSLFWIAQPLMDGIKYLVDATSALAVSHLPDGPIKDLIRQGIFAGVGTVLTFVPQIALLFLFLAILEDTGYLARAAFLMDRLLSKVGLHGKSFIPLLSSFACAIPGIMATRTIENRKDRLATILVAPFMSCSARLPVYMLLIAAFFGSFSPAARGGIMLACYALGILAAVATAFVFKRTFLKGPATSFILELPSYKLPQISQIARQMWTNTKAFITKAGTTIFCLSVILWAMTYYPRLPYDRAQVLRWNAQPSGSPRFKELAGEMLKKEPPINLNGPRESVRYEWAARQARAEHKASLQWLDEITKAEQLRYSFAGRFGHLIEPAIKPLGFDWKMGVGLVGAFAAREVFVSTMGITYAVGDTEESGTADLSKAMQADRYPDGKPVWTPLVAISLLVWFVLAMQCMSTVAIVRRETGGWRWPIFMIVYMNALAYVVSLIVFQVGRIWLA